ncbi:MAG: DNA primase [Planctomycetia bacterium]|nr:DNA primase [Planctomycetia bacterium]
MAIDWETLTKQVKEANDIVDVIGGYLTLHPNGGKFKGLCPFHDDHRPSMVVDPQWQNFRCWACGKFGDVFTFIQERERVDFREARELLARRAGISLEKIVDSPQNRSRAYMLDVMRWADEQYQRCLHELQLAETARRYVAERHLEPETVRRFGLGFSPLSGDWLVQEAAKAKIVPDVLEQVGLIARRREGPGYFDRFRDRLMFPIRNVRGQTVGFGGRILPSSPFSSRAPKYYNSADTPLFSKSEQLYGLDLARQAGSTAGYLAVVEGYTDVMMAHQRGVAQVVATLGTALNARHVQQLRRFAPRVVLVFDGDAAGAKGVDRAVELFVGNDVDLAVARLPDGLDPCDLLAQQGPEPFQQALAGAVDALHFKLDQVLNDPAAAGIEGRRRAVDEVLGLIALAPDSADQTGQLKRELIVGRIARRLGIQEVTLWARLRELRERSKGRESSPGTMPVTEGETPQPASSPRQAPAAPHERELLEVLLAEPGLVATAVAELRPDQVEHPGLRKLLEALFALHAAGQTPDVDRLRDLIDNPRLIEHALRMQEKGRAEPDRSAWLSQLLAEFHRVRELRRKQALQDQLQAAADHQAAVELLRRLQDHGEVRFR